MYCNTRLPMEILNNYKINSYIESLPEGYDTILSDDGVNISKGHKQLITIARAFLSDAPLLILDEATSNVDSRTEIQIQEAMTEFFRHQLEIYFIENPMDAQKICDLFLCQITVLQNFILLQTGTDPVSGHAKII